MPWKTSGVMEEKLRFVFEYQRDEQTMADLCSRFGICRDTGYVWLRRFRLHGVKGLVELNRAAERHPNQTTAELERSVLELRQAHMTWGPRKLKRVLERDQPGRGWPAASTMGEIVKRAGLVVPRKRRRRTEPYTQPLAHASESNLVWCADFKGEFKLGNGRYCFPLTVSDYAARFLLLCEALDSTREDPAITAFERLFHERGLPLAIRSDNGVPFASPNALFNLSKLSVWWLRLGITIERIKPGHPQQNGRHERMHLTLKKEATRPPGFNSLQQQERFDAFVHEFNTERPHEALGMKCPAELYTASTHVYAGLPELSYPFHDRDVVVTACGRLCLHRKKINISTVLAGQKLGIKEVDEGIWLVSFMHYDLGYFDLEQKTLQPLDNPFGPKPVTDVSATNAKP